MCRIMTLVAIHDDRDHDEHEDGGDNLQLNSDSFTNLEVHIRVAPVPEFSMWKLDQDKIC